jgi:hypothetical protein
MVSATLLGVATFAMASSSVAPQVRASQVNDVVAPVLPVSPNTRVPTLTPPPAVSTHTALPPVGEVIPDTSLIEPRVDRTVSRCCSHSTRHAPLSEQAKQEEGRSVVIPSESLPPDTTVPPTPPYTQPICVEPDPLCESEQDHQIHVSTSSGPTRPPESQNPSETFDLEPTVIEDPPVVTDTLTPTVTVPDSTVTPQVSDEAGISSVTELP